MISFVAHEHALRAGQNGVHTDHLLLALSEDRGVRLILQSAGVDIDQLRSTVYSRLTPSSVSHARDGVLPRTNFLHLAWRNAHGLADEQGSLHITPAHLLVATVRALREVRDDAILVVLEPIGTK
jgi:ATP-dependent Clp protease ATP-binding subunit ClpA